MGTNDFEGNDGGPLPPRMTFKPSPQLGAAALMRGHSMAMMSLGAWAVLKQLKQGGVWDGDLIDKAGRTELIGKGLARRDRKFADGPYAGCQINELTSDGAKLAAVCIELDSLYGAAN